MAVRIDVDGCVTQRLDAHTHLGWCHSEQPPLLLSSLHHRLIWLMWQDKLGVSGLFKVLEASEALIALRRSPPQAGDTDTKEGGKGEDQALQKVLARLTQFNLGGEGTVNLSLLGGHANVLDRELQQRLGYTVPEARGEVGLSLTYP